MLNLLDKMFIKRFCLPVNSDIDSYENGSINMLSGGKLNTVIEIFFSAFFFLLSWAHFNARFARRSMRSESGTDLPVAPSRPA
jgi:hypothetical protein